MNNDTELSSPITAIGVKPLPKRPGAWRVFAIGRTRAVMGLWVTQMALTLAGLAAAQGDPALKGLVLGLSSAGCVTLGCLLAWWIHTRNASKMLLVRSSFAFGSLLLGMNAFVIFLGCGTPQGTRPDLRTRHRAYSRSQMAKTAMNIPPRDTAASPDCVDLTQYYNSLLDEGIPSHGTYRTLSGFRPGQQTLSGVEFDARAIIRLCSRPSAEDDRKFPMRVEGIAIGRQCQRIHFLTACNWKILAGKTVATLTMHYAGGQMRQMALRYGQHLVEFCDPIESPREAVAEPPTKSELRVAWKTPDLKAEHRSCVFIVTWENPLPTLPILSVDFESNPEFYCAPLLLAMTCQ
jgi:hypothetical protein